LALAVPLKRVHPDVENGTMQSDILDKLNELSVDSEKKEEKTDPRWDALKNIKLDN
jgi:uncharacterized metal-binding protein YceD (DUF177 family)